MFSLLTQPALNQFIATFSMQVVYAVLKSIVILVVQNEYVNALMELANGTMKIRVFVMLDHVKTHLIIVKMDPSGTHVSMLVSAKAMLNNTASNML